VLLVFRWWEERRETEGRDPLVRLALLQIPQLRAGLSTFGAQNLILMGVFFTIPLYLQLVVGLDALDTGIRMLPISIAMFLTSSSGGVLATRFSPRGIVRVGLVFVLVAILVLAGTIEPELDGWRFGAAMALLGVGMGLLASQLGNVVQSSVGDADRGEAGGLQWTSQQLGSALGVAVIGSIVLTGLTNGYVRAVESDPEIPDDVQVALVESAAGGIDFVAIDDVEQAAGESDLDPDTVDDVVEAYGDAQIRALQAGLLAAALLAVAALAVTRALPSRVLGGDDADDSDGGHDPIEPDDPIDPVGAGRAPPG
jgi:hypothetical protein